MPRRLKINLDDIALAMSDRDRDINQHYLDTQTGEYVLISEEVMTALEEEDEEMLGDLPDWQKEELTKAKEIMADRVERYVVIPPAESRESFNVMTAFVETVSDAKAREFLEFALSGPKPFRRFKDALVKFPKERERWAAFENEAEHAVVREWLLELDIEADEDEA